MCNTPRLQHHKQDQKSFCITQREVREAYRQVKANRGAAGVDGESIAQFEGKLRRNLYQLWNRLSSGSYVPPPVRMVEIPKASGTGVRMLGIPTVADRIAQQVVKARIEPVLDPLFHPDSYGYRPKKSALEAVRIARQRCWQHDWVVDLDVQGYFDNISHDKLMVALRRHITEPWILLYVQRWLVAPAQDLGGALIARPRGTPQGGVVSPLLANLFLHYVFDEWMRQQYPHIPFERYADDMIVHCKTEREAQRLRAAIADRMIACALTLHPEKTKIVYCKDANRRGTYPTESFDFLGFTFRPRWSRRARDGRCFTSFSPAISKTASTAIRATIRSWQLPLCDGLRIEMLSVKFNPQIRGWIQYYGRYGRSALYPILYQLDTALTKWAMKRYRNLRHQKTRANQLLHRIKEAQPELFAHWQLGAWCGDRAVVGAV